jgi:hypothetical protein
MSERIEVEPLGEHDYLVRAWHSAGVAESRFRAGESVLGRVGKGPADEQYVVERSVSYLLAHQPVIDLPPMVDLDDMAAAFDDFLDYLRASGPADGPGPDAG